MNWLLVAILLSLVSIAPAAGTQIGRECYGDAIDVDLIDTPGGPVAELRVPLAIASVSIQTPDSVNPMYACMLEPVTAVSIFLTFNHRPEPVLGLIDGLTLTSLVVSYGGGGWDPDAAAIKDASIARYVASGATAVMPNGFTKLFPTSQYGGHYLSPSSYLEPHGRRLEISCAGGGGSIFSTQCNTFHGAGPGSSLSISYRFYYEKVDPARWLDLDRAVTAAALRLRR